MIRESTSTEMIDRITVFREIVNQPITKNGILMVGRMIEISIPVILLRRIEIPVTPPSRNPLGSKKALSPRLARKTASAS